MSIRTKEDIWADYQLSVYRQLQRLIATQSTNSGDVISTDGQKLIWSGAGGSSLPAQTGHAGKFLTTDGSVSSWAATSGAAWGSITGTLSAQTDLQSALNAKEDTANKGIANGYASLDGTGKVPSAQLPSYVDDVLEYANFAALPGTGTTGLIYVTIDNNKTYRWTGSAYTEISANTPAGSNTEIQFNNSGAFGASSNLTWTGTVLRVDGSLGIGKSPSYALDVQGTSATTNIARFRTSTGATILDIYNSNSEATPVSRLIATGTNLTLYNGVQARRTIGGGEIFGAYDVSNVNRFTVLSTGEVGIGQTVPTSKLDITTNALGVSQTTTSGLALVNTTAAAAGAQQISPAVRWTGQGWKTAATAASQAVEFMADVLPVQGTIVPSGTWQLSASVNGSAYSNILTATSGGIVTLLNTSTQRFAGGASGAQYLWFTPGNYDSGFYSGSANAGITKYAFTFDGITDIFNSSIGGAVRINRNYAPTSGTGIFSSLEISPTLNQTGGANGISRGIYINPTLTAAADWRGLEIARNNLGVTQTVASGILLTNDTDAAAGAQQISPALTFRGRGWKTNATAASQIVDFIADVLPVQGTANPTGTWRLGSSVNGGAYSDLLRVQTNGQLLATTTTETTPAYSFISDPTTGFYNFGSGTFGITSGGVHVGLFSQSTLGAYSNTTNSVSAPNLGLYKRGVNERLSIWMNGSSDFQMQAWTSGVGYDKNIVMQALGGKVGIGTTSPDRLLHAEVADSATNSVTYTSRETHITSGTATTGFGVGKEWELENASGTNRVAATEEITWSDAVDATEDATWKLNLIRAGTLTTALTVASTGTLTTGNDITSGGRVTVATADAFTWTSKSKIYSPSDGIVRLADNANTDFNRLQFGGTTSSFPSIKRNGAGIDFRLADDSAYAAITSQNLILSDTVLAGSGSLAGSVLDIAQTWNTTGLPTAIKLNVTDAASNASSFLMDLQIGGTSRFRIDKSGKITNSNYGGASFSGAVTFNAQGAVAGNYVSIIPVNSFTGTSGAMNILTVGHVSGSGFAPTSGTATHDMVLLNSIINQTGGANGITRGLYVNPTLTAAADFRAIETTQGRVIHTDTYVAGSGSLAGSLLDLAQTWNTSGTPTAIKLNVTDALSNANSFLADLQVGGTSRFNINKSGTVYIAAGSSVTYGFSGRSRIGSDADSNIVLYNNAQSSFGILKFGGTTSSFPSIKRNGTALNFRLADDSGDAPLTAGDITATNYNATTSSTVYISGATGGLLIGNRSQIRSSGDGLLTLLNAAATDFSRLLFGGTSASFPALKRSTTGIIVRLADDSADTDITAAKVISTNVVRLKGYTVATLPGSPTQGDSVYITDLLTPTYLAVVVGGGAVVGTAFYDGTNWVCG